MPFHQRMSSIFSLKKSRLSMTSLTPSTTPEPTLERSTPIEIRQLLDTSDEPQEETIPHNPVMAALREMDPALFVRFEWIVEVLSEDSKTGKAPSNAEIEELNEINELLRHFRRRVIVV